MKDEKREVRKLKKSLKQLTQQVAAFIRLVDREMQQPSTVTRGQKIAALLNDLERANDRARFFGLGIDFRTDLKRSTDACTTAERGTG